MRRITSRPTTDRIIRSGRHVARRHEGRGDDEGKQEKTATQHR